MQVEWSIFKNFVDTRSLSIQWVDIGNKYCLKAFDGNFSLECILIKDLPNNSEVQDFEDHYKANGNKKLEPTKDSDGTVLSRAKVTTTGWSYQVHGMEIETSKLDGFYSKKADNTNFGFATSKFYELVDEVETLITGDNLTQEYLDAHCVKTVIDWEPTYDLEIMGGMMWQNSTPTDDVRFWAIGVPDVPENYGGSKVFAASLNLRHVGNTESLKVDGRAAKYMTYNATYHTTKLRMIFRHPVGVKHQLHMAFELFKA